MAIKIALTLVTALAVAPAVATFAGKSMEEPAMLSRQVELNGPIHGFTQTRNRIQVRLTPARDDVARTRLIVQASGGSDDLEFAVPIRKGQTWLAAELPEGLAHAEGITLRVE